MAFVSRKMTNRQVLPEVTKVVGPDSSSPFRKIAKSSARAAKTSLVDYID